MADRDDEPLDIGEVVQRSGLTVATLHHYEAKGLIVPTGRRGLRRQYAPTVLDRLALITLGRDAGFSLNEIVTLLPADHNLEVDRDQITARAGEIDDLISTLTNTRDTLRHIAACPEPQHMACPRFRELLAASTRRHQHGKVPNLGFGARRREQ